MVYRPRRVYSLCPGVRLPLSFSVIFPSLLEEFKWSRTSPPPCFPCTYSSTESRLHCGLPGGPHGPEEDDGAGDDPSVPGTRSFPLGNQLWYFWITFGLISGAGLCMIGAVLSPRSCATGSRKSAAWPFPFLSGFRRGLRLLPGHCLADRYQGWRNTYLIEGLVVGAVMIP